jgi:hypothetical protein
MDFDVTPVSMNGMTMTLFVFEHLSTRLDLRLEKLCFLQRPVVCLYLPPRDTS